MEDSVHRNEISIKPSTPDSVSVTPPRAQTEARNNEMNVGPDKSLTDNKRESPVISTEEDMRVQHVTESSSREDRADFTASFQQNFAESGRKTLHDFFYVKKPPANSPSRAAPPSMPQPAVSPSTFVRAHTSSQRPNQPPNNRQERDSQPVSPSRIEDDPAVIEQEREDREYVARFWTVYDDIIILSLFTQIGILCRLGMANWFKIFDGVFHSESALFTNLPLNCCSCFLMGILCSGESLMQIIGTRFTPPRLQQDLHREAENEREVSRSLREDSRGSLFAKDDSIDDNIEEGEMGISTCAETPDGYRRRHPWRPVGGRRSQHDRVFSERQRRAIARMTSWRPKHESLQNELRDVQLLALERRIRMSPCLVLFPIKKEDVDVVENYFHDGHRIGPSGLDLQDGYPSTEQGANWKMGFSPGSSPGFLHQASLSLDDHDLSLDEYVSTSDNTSEGETNKRLDFDSRSYESDGPPDEEFQNEILSANSPENSIASPISKNDRVKLPKRESISPTTPDLSVAGQSYACRRPTLRTRQYGQIGNREEVDYGTQELPDLDQMINNVATDVSQKISRMKRVRLVDGWDVGTTPEDKSEDLMLGLRDGLCGALSSFSSWISSMVRLVRGGNIGQAFVGLVLGIQLPIVAYRFGQHIAVYIFVWRCRRETIQDNRRGYGIRLNTDDDNDDNDDNMDCEGRQGFDTSVHFVDSVDTAAAKRSRNKARGQVPMDEDEDDTRTPSVRAIITAIFIMALVAQTTSLNFFYEPESRLVALSLLFSPVGVLTRWRLSKLNTWRPSFPLGTFTCNIGACALSGSLGTVLAGNPGPRERIALVALIAGFGGTLSSVAGFIVEVLAGMDPILFRMDGVYYAVCSVGWGMLVSFLFTASVDWADAVQ